MQITTVLFDLDGTLLPMDQDAFLKLYFAGLTKKLVPHGYEPDSLVRSIQAGTAAMLKNDGSRLNEEAFWNTFCILLGQDRRKDEPLFREFYENEFQETRAACGYTPNSARIIETLRCKGLRTALATNPLFPAIATHSRIRWAGLQPEDFELVTTYENSRHCKPNLDYYRDILDTLQVDPSACLMVGNDVGEDMIAETLGMKVFLLTDCLINKDGKDISSYPHGGFPELLSCIENL